MSGQWRVGNQGRYAFDYNVMFHMLDRLGLDDDHYEALFEDLRMMEAEALQMSQNKT